MPDREAILWRDRRFTYAEADARIDGVAHYLVTRGLGCHTERADLEGHQSGQDHMGLYLRNGNEHLEAMIAGYRARVASFNINYRYVEQELIYLLTDANARALVYAGEFAPQVQSIRDRLPDLEVLIQVVNRRRIPMDEQIVCRRPMTSLPWGTESPLGTDCRVPRSEPGGRHPHLPRHRRVTRRRSLAQRLGPVDPDQHRAGHVQAPLPQAHQQPGDQSGPSATNTLTHTLRPGV